MSDDIPPKFREFIAEKVGAWPKHGDINYPIAEAVNAAADYIDMIAARVFGDRLDD